MAAGEGGAESLPPPSPFLPGPERALEEAAASGKLSLAGRHLRHFPGGAARRWDLSDTTQADLSRNRFAEVPEAACHLMSLEGLTLYHNCLRSIPPAIANLQALTYLNLSRNQLTSLPACLCCLPLKVLIASNNKLVSLPDDIGTLHNLRQLDVSSNELQSLPLSMGGLESLRDLSIRRNQIDSLPEELGELPLVRLDFSYNRVARIPVCYRHLRYLQCILLEHNPLQSPPAQVGKAGGDPPPRTEGEPVGSVPNNSAVPSPPSLLEEFYPMRQYGGLDSGFNSVDSGSKRWSGNESTDEFSDLSFRIAELARDPRQLKEKRNGAADASETEQIDYIDSSINGDEEEEEQQKPVKGSLQRAGGGSAVEQSLSSRASVGAALPRPEPSGEERRRPEVLQLWQERERQQQLQPPRALWSQGPGRGGTGLSWPEPYPAEPSHTLRLRAGSQALDERELTAQLRKAIESHLKITLAEDLGEALANGVILCQLINHLRPRSVPFIHVPSPAVPKLNAIKSRKNVESFLQACRHLGVPEVSLCSASDVVRGNTHGLLRLLLALPGLAPGRAVPPVPAAPLSEHLLGFGFFHVSLMLLLYLGYRKLCSF
ncbi:PREDICTED: leucine-rich repeat and calponin homology domain-containing protein 4 [Gekko japonicus]|uniref:Leucine-rich repeat and calponin homology domain-containing protein 4 n=1 Tax=Gekko japonicus TaxID=146911 RepID=A0ABM1LBP4_GEKJA|nr:PREDICTED: leucine-rich repeat and calponin homology domain-containing protein 4 [Gekko japonicus]